MAIAFRHRVKAATLMETLVAMVILLVVFLISTMIIQNVLKSVYIGAKVKSYFALQQALAETKREHQFFDNETKSEQFIIIRSIKDCALSDSLLVISLEAKDNKGTLLSTVREIVRKYE